MFLAGVILCATGWAAVPAGASTGWQVHPLPRPANTRSVLNGVSCTASGSCTAVGTYDDTSTDVVYTLAEHRTSGGGWASQPTPSPGTAHGLNSVSCPSAADCTAFGGYGGSGRSGTLVEHWDGSSWTIQSSPNPAGTPEAEFYSGSCASPTSCTAVGYYTGPSGGDLPLAEQWNGTAWTIHHVPLPTRTSQGNLLGVSCRSATNCTAVGDYELRLGASTALAEHWNGTAWKFQTVPAPTVVSLYGVSCSSATACTAVGYAGTASSTPGPFAERWDGTAWTTQAVQNPLGNTILFAVSCPSASSCTAVGTDSSNTGVAEYWNGTSWMTQPTPAPRSMKSTTLTGVSCRSATTCTAVGNYGKGWTLVDRE